jgi:hypothetical protein
MNEGMAVGKPEGSAVGKPDGSGGRLLGSVSVGNGKGIPGGFV